jgi:hypothetical protein
MAPLRSVAASDTRAYHRITRSSPPRRCPQIVPFRFTHRPLSGTRCIPTKGEESGVGSRSYRLHSEGSAGACRFRQRPPREIERPGSVPAPIGAGTDDERDESRESHRPLEERGRVQRACMPTNHEIFHLLEVAAVGSSCYGLILSVLEIRASPRSVRFGDALSGVRTSRSPPGRAGARRRQAPPRRVARARRALLRSARSRAARSD